MRTLRLPYRLPLLVSLWLVSLASFAQKQRLTVAQDGSGDFRTVQEALRTVPPHNATRITIFIRKGTYKEKLTLDSTQHFVTLVGEDKTATVLTWDDFSGKVLPDGRKLTTSTSASFYIFANDFRAENLTFENTAGPVGQAVAAFVTGDRAAFVNCRFLGFQDTLYTGSPRHWGRQYYRDCYIEGTTDFIFGSATAVFERCVIFSKKSGQYITAASTPEGQPFGYVFIDCTLTSDAPTGSVYLGRPWRPFARTVFLRSTLGSHIRPEGWHNWSKPDAEKTTLYAEFENQGPGASPATRVGWSKQLTPHEAKAYTREAIFGGRPDWLTTRHTGGLTGRRDTSFTVYGAYQKTLKTHPSIRIAAPAPPRSVGADLNVPYLVAQPGRTLRLDAFYPKARSQRPRPAVVLIHGGGWRSGDRTQQIPMAQQLAAQGFVAVTVEYRLSTEALYPAAVQDLKAAVRWLRINAHRYGVDTARIAALGCSAGGQLAALLGAKGTPPYLEGTGNPGPSSAVQAVVNIDGVLAFIHPESGEGDDRRATSAGTHWFGYPASENPALWHEASALTYAAQTTTPMLILNSAVDRMHAGRDDLRRQLAARGVYTEVHTFADAPHPFWLFHPWFEPTMRHTVRFLAKTLRH